MITYAIAYLATLVLFVVADMIWLGTMVNRFYRPALGDMLLTGVNLPPAFVFYAVYPLGVMIFAIVPALRDGLIGTAVLNGALFGFFTYATYNLTNYATLRGWPLQVTIADMGWGTALGAIAATGGFLAVSRFVV
jgi:uncharacterized membrane protein